MKTAVVTGGTKGIGRAIASRLVADGFAVVVAARNPGEPIAGTRFAPLDVTDSLAVRHFFAERGSLHVLVNAAGIAGAHGLDAADDPVWDAVLATNLTGTYACCAAALALLPDISGRIVNIASVLGLRGVADQPAYCAAKHGVIGLTRSLAMLAAPRGITVNAVCPGWVDTDMAAARFAELGITAEKAAAGIPTRRLASAAEVADTVAFLAGPGAASITGQALAVDGGVVAGFA
jgi:NAD(P)-dependent dehydrogenase (short-subunit alcohol dehydrogenase family)